MCRPARRQLIVEPACSAPGMAARWSDSRRVNAASDGAVGYFRGGITIETDNWPSASNPGSTAVSVFRLQAEPTSTLSPRAAA